MVRNRDDGIIALLCWRARNVNKQQGQGELGEKPVQALLELVISAIDEDVLPEVSVDFFWINIETVG